mgnify:CR=1 FL=1
MTDPYRQSKSLGLPGRLNGQRDSSTADELIQARSTPDYQKEFYKMRPRRGGLSAALGTGHTFCDREVDNKSFDAVNCWLSLALDEAHA